MMRLKLTHRSESHWAEVVAGVTAARVQIKAGVLGGVSDDGVPLPEIAAFNELGTSSSPARPFVSPGVRRVRGEVSKLLVEAAQAALRGEDPSPLYHDAGELMASGIRSQIDSGQFVALAPSTIRRKGHDQPLVSSGRMRAAVTYEVS